LFYFRAISILAVLIFAVSLGRRLRPLLATRSLSRMDRHGERLKGLLIRVFGQRKLFYDPLPGLAHALIFWGFCIISIESVHFFLSAFGLDLRLPLTRGAFLGLYELFMVLVGLGVIYALVRRTCFSTRVVKSWDALLILGLIMALVVSGLIISAQESAISGQRLGWKFVTNGLGAAENRGIYSTAWWIHGLIFLFFLNYLPYSKHMHVLTVVFNVYFRDLDPKGRMPKLDLENSERFGLADRRDLTFKDMLDGYTCTECGRCTAVCPANRVGKHLDPKRIILGIRDYVGKTETNRPKQSEQPEPIADNFIPKQDIFDCTTCYACVSACPVENEHLSKILGMRQNLVLMEGNMPPEYERTFRNLENNANPWGLPADQRGQLSASLGLPTLAEHPAAEHVFFLGCAGCYDARAKSVVERLAAIMQHAGLDAAVLGEQEFCCGDPARRMGNEYLFQTMVESNREIIEENWLIGKKIITTDPHCFNTLKNEYPDFGLELDVEHHSTLLQRLLADGRIEPQVQSGRKITYHDSCYLGRYNDNVSAPRQSLAALGYRVEEMRSNRRTSMCCGAGGGRAFMEEDSGQRVNVARVQEALQTNAETIAVACPYCALMFEDGLKTTSSDRRVYDLAELVAASLPPTNEKT